MYYREILANCTGVIISSARKSQQWPNDVLANQLSDDDVHETSQCPFKLHIQIVDIAKIPMLVH